VKTTYRAIKALPTESKISLSRVFDQWVKDYESGNGDRDPAAWFAGRKSEIEKSVAGAGIRFAPFMLNMADAAYSYYCDL
jgi:hypothetical protein